MFNFTQPYAALLQRLNSTEAPILPKHVYEGVDDVQTADANLAPVGTGPFKLESYDIDNEIVLVRNDDYFKAGLPYLDRVVMQGDPDQNTQVLALEQGEVDYMWRVPGGEIERLRGDDSIVLHGVNSGPGGGFCIPTLTFNSERDVFSDLRVRQAIAHAVNRDQMLAQVIFGQGKVATGPINSQMAFAYSDDVTTYAYDVDRANALLDEAGYGGDGTRFSIDLLVFSFGDFPKYAEVMRQNLAEVGIEVEVSRWTAAPSSRGCSASATSTPTSSATATTPIPRSAWPACTSPATSATSRSRTGRRTSTRSIDELFDAAASTPDVARRGELYGEIQQILTAELPYLWLLETRFTAGSGANVRRPAGQLRPRRRGGLARAVEPR